MWVYDDTFQNGIHGRTKGALRLDEGGATADEWGGGWTAAYTAYKAWLLDRMLLFSCTVCHCVRVVDGRWSAGFVGVV